MKIVAQRVLQASVTVDGKIISEINKGLLVLVGFTKGNSKANIEQMVSKTLNMRLFELEEKHWNGSVKDINGEIMVVSQFTLYGFFKGNKPDFHDALTAEEAKQQYQNYVELLKKNYIPDRIKTGQFQAKMIVRSANDGPVTLLYQREAEKQKIKKTKQAIQTKFMKQQNLQESKNQTNVQYLQKK